MFKERATPNTITTKIDNKTGAKPPVLFISPLAFDKMQIIVEECSQEVGWLGFIEEVWNEEGNKITCYYLKDVILLKQEVNGATCELDKTAVAELYESYYLNGDPKEIAIAESILLWGHSHVNMGVLPSSQDDKQVLEFGKNNPYFFRLIANKKGEMEIDFYDFENNLKHKNIPWKQYRPNRSDIIEEVKADIKEKVKQKSYAYSGYRRGHWDYTTQSYVYDDDYEKKTTTGGEDNTIGFKGNKTGKEEKEDFGKEKEFAYFKEVDGVEEIFFALEINTDFMDNTFDPDEMLAIARCKDADNSSILVNLYDRYNVYETEDYEKIYEFCKNRFPQ